MITHSQRYQIVRALLKPEQFAAKGAKARELKIMREVTKGGTIYGAYDFWINLGLGFSLNSCAWFKTPDGSATLERAWRLWGMSEVQRELYLAKEREENQNLLDTALNTLSMDETETDSSTALQPERPVVKRRMTPLAWADSKD